MNSYAQLKAKEQSRAVANMQLRKGQDSVAVGRQLNGLSALQERANLSPEVRHVAQMQQMLNASPRMRASVQRKENNTGMPDHLKAGLEQLSGMSLDGTSVHYNSSEPARFGANAITQGKDIHVGLGQERHVGHEGWHRVQQIQGLVQATTQMHGMAINTDSTLEREADVMGAKAEGLHSRGDALMNPATAIRRGASQMVSQHKVATSAPSRPVAQMNGDGESPFWKFFRTHIYGEHSYRLSHQVHSRSPGQTDEEATKKTFDIIKKHPAPLSLGRESTEEGRTMWIPPFGQINTMTNPLQHYLTNVTMPGRHFLHPGFVKRTAVGESVITEGGGTGMFPSLNVGLANMLWGSMAYRDRLKSDPAFARKHYADVMEKTLIS
jgi:hypothetical protein